MSGGGGDGAEDHSGSVFRVGDNVELLRVVAMVSVLVVCVMFAERAVHRAEHNLQRYPKYQEMLTKVFGELTILGFIGLGIKVLMEIGGLDPYSKPMIAFQAADMTVFLVAIALILQALVVFFRLRRKNIQADKAELLSTQHLVDLLARTGLPAWYHEFKANFTYARRQSRTQISRTDLPEVARLRILRHFFLKRYGLPELFPFSKYLRQAQDNQISHMIEVEISTWMVLLLIAWGLGSVAKLIDHTYDTEYSIVIAFRIFSWASVFLHVAIVVYFGWAVDQLLDAAVDAPSRGTDRYLYLNQIAEHEAQAMDRELAADAVAVMERVREHEQTKRVPRKRNFLTKHDTGFQLIATIFRKIGSTVVRRPRENDTTTQDAEGGAMPSDASGEQPAVVQGPVVKLRFFSRKAWHFIIMSTLMLNALYVALFCQCVIYQMQSLYDKYGFRAIWALPLPLLLNMNIFQSRILRNFILVSAIVRLDDTALGDVIDHFTETVQLRASFVQSVHAYLEASNQTVADLQSEFEARDPKKSGVLDAEDVRLVLQRFGFKLTFFRFNSVAKLLFDFRGMKIEYAQVIRLLEIGQSDALRSLASLDEYNTSLAPSSTASPYVTGNANLRNDNLLLRAKSSAANSLYRMNIQLEDPFPTEPSSPETGGTPHVML